MDLLRSAPGPLDVMLAAKDLSVLDARAALERLFPGLAALEERTLPRGDDGRAGGPARPWRNDAAQYRN